MNVYFACTGKDEPRFLTEHGFKNILCSYHYYKNDRDSIQFVMDRGANLFCDSGAFSAKHAGAEISIDEYSRFLIDNKIGIYVSLDVINDAPKTLANWLYMKEEHGLNPIPTFHTREPMEFLERYVAECDYIALGGMVGLDDLQVWLDQVWTYIVRNKPTLKVHGFGMTSVDTIYRYPWYSFDSSSFKSGKRFGRIPQFNGKKMYQITVDEFKFKYIKECPDEFTTAWNKQFNKAIDIQGAQAYHDMVQYLTKFEKRCEFINQLSLF